jgi:predicted O-linked N-acetylglucosamine transferase (SPINDLY family)
MLAGQGKTDAARQCYAKALRLNPRQVVWRLSMASLCPRIFTNNQEIDAYRQALLRELESFAAARHTVVPSQLQASDCKPSFNLQFHGRDDRPIREAYARIFNDCFLEERVIGSPGRPRIGFVVTDRHEKGFVKSMGGIVERMDPTLFELVVVGSHRGTPLLRSGIRSEAVRLLGLPATFDQIANAIRQLQFDLLYYWEVGTDNTNYFLPFLRLAPVQCTSWGIQVTSGIAQVDHYLSAALVEPEDAAGHYTENLVLASTLLTYRPRVSVPVPLKGREYFGIAPSQHLYLCAQQLGKFHPDFDPLLAGILRQDPNGVVVIVEDLHGAFVAEQLRARFAKTLSDVADRILFLPFQETGDYLSLIAAADVLLDPPHFGGVNTSYDGFSLHKPIVTLPSQFQRGRYTLGCYRKMGISDTVALDPRQYIDIAVALGTDAAFRHHVSQRIERASHALFEDTQAVHEHERIFRELIEEARSVGRPRRP